MNGSLPDRSDALRLEAAGPFAPERRDRLPDWGSLLAREAAVWGGARARTVGGPRVLIPTVVGGLAHAGVVESVLAAALTLRGAAVEFVLCDGALGACQLAVHGSTVSAARLAAGELDRTLCGACHAVGSRTLDGMGLPVHRLSRLIESSDRQAAAAEAAAVPMSAMAGYHRDGLPLGEHAVAGALRFFAVGDLAAEPLAEAVLRRYLEAGILTAGATARLLAGRGFDRAVFHHGIYVPQGIVRAVLTGAGVPLATWNPAYRRNSFVFSHGDTYHHTMLDEPDSAWSGLDLDDENGLTLASYLLSRLDGDRDWIWFHERPESGLEAFAARSGLDLDRPVAGAFTNVIWDARLHFRSSAYPDQIDWLADTVAWAASDPGRQLVIRVHPAEIRGAVRSRQQVIDALTKRVGRIPANVFLVPPEDPVSSYALAALCRPVLVFGTKAAMEFAAAGLDVVTVGDAWTRGKRITRDPADPSAYRRLLDDPGLGDPRRGGPSVERTAAARRHAYHVFLRRMIPLPLFRPTGEDPPLAIAFDTLAALQPGAHPGLDVVCDGILRGAPFVYDAGRYGPADGRLVPL